MRKMDEYNVNELNAVNGTPDEVVTESPADEVANEVTAAVTICCADNRLYSR